MKTPQEQVQEIHGTYELWWELDGINIAAPELRDHFRAAFLAGVLARGDQFHLELETIMEQALAAARADMRERCAGVVEDFHARFTSQHHVTSIDDLLALLCKRLAELIRELPCDGAR